MRESTGGRLPDAEATVQRARRIRIPRDVELIKELAGLRYEYNSQGRMQIESKRKMRRRGISSPDKADALMLAFLDDERDRFLDG